MKGMLEKEKYEDRKWWIEQHRKMWSNLAIEVKTDRINTNMVKMNRIKTDYMSNIYGGNIPIKGCCYCCEYAWYVNQVLICHGWDEEHVCNCCPIIWKNDSCLLGEYGELYSDLSYGKGASICKRIAELPESQMLKFLIQTEKTKKVLNIDEIIRMHNRGETFRITHKVFVAKEANVYDG